ncbi:MAG: polyprenyl synthetase family protein [Verrucomicrobiaceae bacterium]|nr:polyprenyl synthetase family protein [Verrucomicrobiaceae bacterium]
MNHPIEWWFVQGRFEGDGVEPREFMVSLFRHKLEWGCLSAGDSSTLLVSVLDPKEGRCHTLSQVDSETVPFLVLATRTTSMPGLDPLAIRAVTDEIEQYGPANLIHVESEKPRLESAPFRATWADFSFQQEAVGFTLCFKEPDTGRAFSFRMVPTHPRIHLESVQVAGGGAMDYVSYTRLKLDGVVDGKPVEGLAWFDHQWGDQGWFVAGTEKERILGWDWLGIQLDDDRDLLVIVHRDQHTGRQICQYAVEVDKAGTKRVHREFTLTPLGWWTSHRTEACYPIRWRFELPEVGIVLEFEPLVEDQEIAALPPIRAVWEGAGRVTGTSHGKAIAGWARLELHGYAYVLDLDASLERITRRIQSHITNFLPRAFTQQDLVRWAGTKRGGYNAEAQSKMVAEPLWDLMDRGSRQWRPIFGILMVGAMGVDPRPYESLITVTTELLHDGSLIIDDIQDNGITRRGADCIHLRYGVDVAINAGNTAYFMPLVLLRDYPGLSDAQRLDLYRVLTNLYIGAHFGQGQDIYLSSKVTPERLQDLMADGTAERQLFCYTQKTASVVEAAAEGAAIIANANPELRSACASFGRVLGVAFQVVNDLVDFSASRVRAGTAGSDLREGKVTPVVLRALQLLPMDSRRRLETIICDPALRQDEHAITEGIALVCASNAIHLCKAEARDMVEMEWIKLSKHLPPSEEKQMLRVLWTFLVGLADDERHEAYAPGN